MNKCLYFICPTDHLEVIINNSFTEDSYFCTALASSVNFNNDTIGYIKDLLESMNIRKITFILSDNNQIINKALTKEEFSKTERLNNLYNEIKNQKNRFSLLIQKKELIFSIISYYLNKKIKGLKNELKYLWFSDHIEINAKMYCCKTKKFSTINLNNFYEECFYLN